MAAPPNPSPGSATVDGATADWSLGADFFADMTASGIADRTVRSKLYLRYDCADEVLYGLVLVTGDEKIKQTDPTESYLRIDGTGKLVHGNSGNDGTPPDFAWVNPDGTGADGFEVSGSLAPGSYTIRAHTLILDDSADGYASIDTVGREVPLVIACQAEPTPTPTPTPTPAPTATPTPTPTGGVGPTQGTNTPDPTGDTAPTQRTNPQATLPPTDTLDPASPTSSTDSLGLVILLLGVGSVASIAATHARRRRSIAVTVKESIEPR
jgi:hypothetical protein